MTAKDLLDYIKQHRRVTGKLPNLRECLEHFDGKLLNVLLCLNELDAATREEIRRIAREERKAKKENT